MSVPPEDNRAKRRAYHAAYYRAHRDEELSKAKARKATIPVEVRQASRRAQYLANREKALATQKARRDADPEGYKARMQAWYLANKNEQDARRRRWYVEHREEILAQKKRQRLENLEKERAQDKAYYDANQAMLVDKARTKRLLHPEIRAEWYTDNREAILAKSRMRYEANPEKELARCKVYRQAHPEIDRASVKRRRARKALAPANDLTAAQWEEIKNAYGHRCVYCHRKMQRLTQDHITPLGPNGPHTLHNSVPACQSCNSKKRCGPVPVPVQPLLLTVTPAKPWKPRGKTSKQGEKGDLGEER